MDRFKDKPGGDLSLWILDHHKIWKWIQDFIENNIKKWLVRWMVQPGVIFLGSSDTSLKNTTSVKNGGNIDLTVEAGAGITKLGDMIILASQTLYAITYPGPSVTRYFYFKRVAVDDTDATYDITRTPSSMADINIHSIDSFTAHLDSAWPTGGAEDDIVRIAQIDIDGGDVVTITDARVQSRPFFLNATAIDWINDNQGLTKDGTSENAFTVAGTAVVLTGDVPVDPLNLRITDISTIGGTNIHADADGIMPVSAQKGIISSKVEVSIAWNWDDIEGTGGNNIFTITNDAYNADGYFSADELNGYFLWLSGTNYKITDTAATTGGTTVLTVTNLDDSSVNLTGINATAGSPAWVHELVDSYLVSAIPNDSSDNPDTSLAIESLVSVAQGPVPMRRMLNLDLGTYYNIYVIGKLNFEKSATKLMPAGSYIKYSTTQNYAQPAFIQPAALSQTPTPALSLITDDFGFEVRITGWLSASDFEIVYTADSAAADFDNESHFKKIISERGVQIATSTAKSYNVQVRPLVSGMVAAISGNWLSGDVVSGGGGVMPSDKMLLSSPMKISTLSGSADIVILFGLPGRWKMTYSGLESPSGSGDVKELYDRELDGEILTDSAGSDFILVAGRGLTLRMKNLSGANLTPQTGAFTIGTSKRARRIYISGKSFDNYVLTRAVASIRVADDVTSTPGVLRLYPDGAENQADFISITSEDQIVSQDLNVEVSDISGDRQLVIDAFDPGGTPNNDWSLNGTIVVYARSKVV